jgi:hypothetical protein
MSPRRGRLLAATLATLLATVLSAALPGRADAATGYLNLHQCLYFSSFNGDALTYVLPTGNAFYNTGTSVSSTPESTPRCGPGNTGYVYQPGLSGVVALNLTAGVYLNLHQCLYFSSFNGDALTYLLPTGNAFYNTGTNVSNTPDTTPRCGPGNTGYVYQPGLSGVVALRIA